MTMMGPLNFERGLISRCSVFNSPKGSLYTCNNFRSFYGSLQENTGSNNINSSVMGTGVGFCCGVFPANLAPSLPMVAVFDEKIYSLNVGGTPTDISGAAQFAATSQHQVTADSLNGIMVIGDPIGTSTWLAQWSGSGNCTKLTAAPDGRLVLTVNNFMFVSGVLANPSTVYWSAVSDPTTWPAANSITFRQGDGDKIVALSYIGTDLYIFKNFSIGRLSTSTTVVSGAVTLGPLTTVSTTIGAATTRSVDRLPDGRLVIWGADGHAYIFDGSTITDISDQDFPLPSIQDLFNSIQPDVSIMSVSVYPPRAEVWFTSVLQAGVVAGRQMVYNYQSNQWFDFEPNVAGGTPPNAPLSYSYTQFIPLLDGKGLATHGTFPYAGTLVAGSNVNGYLYALDAVASNDNFTAQWNISIQLNGEGRTFIPRSLLMFYKSTAANTPSMIVSYGFDNGTIGNSTTVTPTTSYQRLIKPIVSPNTSFSTIQIQVTGISTSHGLVVEPFWLSDEVMN